MRNCHPGQPLLVDRSEANALEIAATLEEGAAGAVAGRERRPAVAPA